MILSNKYNNKIKKMNNNKNNEIEQETKLHL